MSSFELIYTSAPRGLKPGTSGFATVAKTRSIPPNVAAVAETLSGFRGSLPNGFAAFSQLSLKIGSTRYLFFSRIADCGLDYSGRANYIAHHWAFDAAEAARFGLNPNAFWTNERDLFVRRWNREPEATSEKDWTFWTAARRETTAPRRCESWEKATGDAGWGAVFAATALCGRRATLLVAPEIDLTTLFAEALGTLPPETARRVSFAAPFFAAPIGVEIGWRGAWTGAPSENAVRGANRNALFFDASTPGRVSLDGKTSTPEEAARLLTGDFELTNRIKAARFGGDSGVILSGFVESKNGDKRREKQSCDDAARRGPDGRPPIRRVAVPGFAPNSNDDETVPFVDENGRVDLRRRHIESDDAKTTNDAADEFWRSVRSTGDVFLENDQKNAETERLNELYDRLAAENRRKKNAQMEKLGTKNAVFWCAVVLLSLVVAAVVAFGGFSFEKKGGATNVSSNEKHAE